MNRIHDKAIATHQALETLCFLCWCAPIATTITYNHFETGGGGTSRPHQPTSYYFSDTHATVNQKHEVNFWPRNDFRCNFPVVQRLL